MIQISTAPLPCASICLVKPHGRLQAPRAVWSGKAVGQRKGHVTDQSDPTGSDARGHVARLAACAQRTSPNQTTGNMRRHGPGLGRAWGRHDRVPGLADRVGTGSANHGTRSFQRRGLIRHGHLRVQIPSSRNDRAATSCVNFLYSPFGRWLPALRRSKHR